MTTPGKIVKTKLFIGNLDPGTQTPELSELFSSFGNVMEASVIKDYGFVHYGTIEEAEKAVAGLNNKEFHGKRLRVELSTSTVRHRPGQPEPASALRHSRSRQSAATSGNGVSRYAAAPPPASGVGPMRHQPSAWIRNDARPYAHMPRDPGAMVPDYGLPPSPYDRPRAYDVRAESRRYYPDERDNGYAGGYDAPGYGGSRGGGEPIDLHSSRHYHDLPPHGRTDTAIYSSNRSYDRRDDLTPVDPYYDGGVPRGSPAAPDPYQQYDPYQKFYPGRPRDAAYLGPTDGVPPSSREYDLYPNYRREPYGSANGQGAYRHHSGVPSPPQHQGLHPSAAAAAPHRQSGLYPSGSSGGYPPPPHSQYYGAHQRA